MQFSTELIEHEFGPKEAAIVSGVSTTLQRDWRRRGILSQSNDLSWSRYSLSDVIQMTILNRLSEYGISVKFASESVVPAAIAAVHTHIEQIETPIEYEQNIPEKARVLIKNARLSDAKRSHARRYVAVIGNQRENRMKVLRADTLSELDDTIGLNETPVFCILDCQAFAREIIQRSDGPIIRLEVKMLQMEGDE